MPQSNLSEAVYEALSSDDRFTRVLGKPHLNGALRGSFGVYVDDSHVASVGVLHYGGDVFVRVIPEDKEDPKPVGLSCRDHVEHVYRVLEASGLPAEPYHFRRPAA